MDTVKSERISKQERLDEIAKIIENVDSRCMAYDGNVGDTLREMKEGEIKRIYELTTLEANGNEGSDGESLPT